MHYFTTLLFFSQISTVVGLKLMANMAKQKHSVDESFDVGAAFDVVMEHAVLEGQCFTLCLVRGGVLCVVRGSALCVIRGTGNFVPQSAVATDSAVAKASVADGLGL